MNNESNSQNSPLPDRTTSDRAMILFLMGCLLLMPPLAAIFQLDIRILGIPFTGLYLFTVWAGLIAGAAALSRRTQKNANWGDPEDPGPEEEVDNSI